jgi:hypothetical protein
MLALRWPPGHWLLDAGFWTLVPSDAGCHRHWSLSALVVFGSGWCEKPAQSTVYNPTTDPTGSPDDYQEFLYEIWVTETVKIPRRRSQLIPLRTGGCCLSNACRRDGSPAVAREYFSLTDLSDLIEDHFIVAQEVRATGLVVIALRKASGEATVEMVCVPSPTPWMVRSP